MKRKHASTLYFSFPKNLLKASIAATVSIGFIGVVSTAYAYPDPNKNDHTLAYGAGKDLVPAECRAGNHLLWENKKPDKVFDNDAQHDKLVFRKSMKIFKGDDLPKVLKNPPAGGTLLNVKSLGAWEPEGDWRDHEQMLIVVLGESDKVLWVSKPTNDLPSTVFASSVVNGGSVLITEKVKEIRISHVDNKNYGIGVNNFRGSVIPDHVCIEYTAPSSPPPKIEACFDPILIDDDDNHRIWKITGAKNLKELKGVNLNDGKGADLIQVGSYSLGYNIQALAYDDNKQVWALGSGTGKDGTQFGHAYIGQIIEKKGKYSLKNITDLGATYQDDNSGKALVWDSANQYFIYDANAQRAAGKTMLKAFDPVSKKVVKDPWGTGNPVLSFDLPRPTQHRHMQGLAFSPDGFLYGIVGVYPSMLIKFEINAKKRLTGKISLIGQPSLGIGLNNLEVIDFTNDGQLLVVDSNVSSNNNKGKVFTVDLATGKATEVASLDGGYKSNRDWEGIKFCNKPFAADPPPPASCDVSNDLNFENPVLESGKKKKTGAVYRFSNVTNGVDALLEILNADNVNIGKIDDATTGTSSSLQIEMLQNQSAGASVPDQQLETEIRFVKSATNTPVKIPTVYATGVDIDGDEKGTLEYSILKKANSYTLESPTNLHSPSAGYYTPIKNKNYAGIDLSKTESMVTATYNNISSLRYTTGFTNNGADYVSNHRLSSLSFSCINYKTPAKAKTVAGFVFQDKNSNDKYDSGEAGLGEVSVSLYRDINHDGKIDKGDTLIQTSSTDIDGHYQLSTMVDGNYLVTVDESDTDIPANHSIGGDNPLMININGSNISNADFPFDKALCEAFSGEISETALTSPAQISNKDFVIVPSSALSPSSGHLRAYKIQDSGLPKSSAKWDAANKMSVNKRANKLYSTNSKGGKILFNKLDKSAFASSKNQAKTIKAYTLNPSYQSGKYLSGRENGTYLGSMSRGNGIVLLNQAMDTFKYLADKSYQTYYQDVVSKRKKRVLVANDDGFLYSVNYKNGELAWAWMPRSLAKELKDYENFQANEFMRGQINSLDLKDSSHYAPYIVGAYKGGLGHYVLKLNKKSASKSALKKVIWDSDRSSSFVSSPENGKMEYFSDDNGNTYVTYVMTNSSNESTLIIRSLVSDKTNLQIALGKNITTTPYVMVDYQKHNAPARKTLYIGDSKGNLYSAALLKSNGELRDKKDIKSDLNSGLIASLDSSTTDAVRFIGASVSSTDRAYYLRAQSETRLSIFKYDAQKSTWKRVWSSFVGGSGQWQADGTHSNNPKSIQALPTGAIITDNAYIVGDSIVLPVNIPDTTGTVCYGLAYYYLYKLNDGSFPKTRFYKLDDSQISGNIKIGYGKASRLVLSDLPDKDIMVGYAHAEQKNDKTTGVNDTFIIRDNLTTGIRSWKILEDLD